MKRLSIGCWLLAWGAWAWMGFGLLRELPRELAPEVRRLPLANGARVLGFVGDTNHVAVLPPVDDCSTPPKLKLFDAETGSDLGERPAPEAEGVFAKTSDPYFERYREPLRHGILCGSLSTASGPSGFHAFDVVNGSWLPLTKRPVQEHWKALHPQKPWLSVFEGPSGGRAERVEVFDLTDGASLFSRDLPLGMELADRPFFFVDKSAVVLPLMNSSEKQDGADQTTLEVWKLFPTPQLESTVEIATRNFVVHSVSSDGRMAFGGMIEKSGENRRWVELYDFNERRFHSCIPMQEQLRGGEIIRRFSPNLTLLHTGRSFLRYGIETTLRSEGAGVDEHVQVIATLTEFDTGRTLWRAGPTERVAATDRGQVFLVEEYWGQLWKQWFPKLKYQSVAVRSLEDGRLLSRMARGARIDPRDCNARGTLLALPNGAIHPLPPRVNWPLLALCQTILALPLILLWAVLRWRSNRRTLLASVTS